MATTKKTAQPKKKGQYIKKMTQDQLKAYGDAWSQPPELAKKPKLKKKG